MSSVAVELTVVILLVFLNGLFAMSEMAVVSARKARLEQMANEGNRRARVALDLAAEPNQLLSTVQIGITLVGIFVGAFSGATFSAPLAQQLRQVPMVARYADAISFGLVVLGITYLSLILGELVPKRLALNAPERVAALVAVPMRGLAALVSPFVTLLSVSTELVLRILRVRPSDEAPVTEEEVKILIQRGAQAGVFDEAEQEIVESVFRLSDRTIDALMTPRTDVTWLDAQRPIAELRRVVADSLHSRFPLADGSLDDILGIVAAKDILLLGDRPEDLRAIAVRPPFFPETMHAFRGLEEFKLRRAHMAIVIDEYGSPLGIVTVTDILEAIVGDLPSLGGIEEPAIVRRPDGSWSLDGMLATDDVKRVLGLVALPGEADNDYRTLGGMLMKELGKVPVVGDELRWHGLRFEILDVDGHRVDRVLVAAVDAEVPPQSGAARPRPEGDNLPESGLPASPVVAVPPTDPSQSDDAGASSGA